MTVSRCLSSHAMTSLLTWRNPQGSEENWILRGNGWQHCGKIITTEIGLAILVTVAVIETIVYSILLSLSAILISLTDRPFDFFAKLLQSSSFTILWGIADCLIYNPLFINVMTRESFARKFAQMINPTSIGLVRLEDDLEIMDWEQRRPRNVNDPMLGPIIVEGQALQKIVDEGANFIFEHVISGADANTKTLIQDTDPDMYMFVVTKAVFVYAVGSKCKDPVPAFFKPETCNSILRLRQSAYDAATIKQLQQATSTPAGFETGPQDANAKSAFTDLRSIASEELQNSLFATRCWQKAINR